MFIDSHMQIRLSTHKKKDNGPGKELSYKKTVKDKNIK